VEIGLLSSYNKGPESYNFAYRVTVAQNRVTVAPTDIQFRQT